MFFIRDCNEKIVGNANGYKTMRGAQAQTSPRKPTGRAIWAAYDARELSYDNNRTPLENRRRNVSSIRWKD